MSLRMLVVGPGLRRDDGIREPHQDNATVLVVRPVG
jgi:hypothetical protein